MQRIVAVFTASFVAVTMDVHADRWASPTTVRICSTNENFCADLHPRGQDPTEHPRDHVRDEAKLNASAKLTATATVLRRSNGKYQRIRAFSLVNGLAPADALLSSDGRYLVTFDNWASLGGGDNVVVIYRDDGFLVKKYSLVQLLSEKKVKTLPMSASSIWWRGKPELDERLGHVVIPVVADGTKLLDENKKFVKIRISLISGEMVAK